MAKETRQKASSMTDCARDREPASHSFGFTQLRRKAPSCEAGMKGGKDSEVRGIRQNSKPHIMKFPYPFCLRHE